MLKERIKKIKILFGPYKFLRKIFLTPVIIYFYNKNKLSALMKAENLKLEFGLRERKEGWITVDMSKGADLRLNLVKKLPFKENSIYEIHSEHFFEHLDLDQIKFCLKECFRILKVGGKISFGVPDFKKAVKVYLENDNFFLKEKFWLSPNPDWCKCKMDYLNFLIYADGNHKFMFDNESGIKRLQEAGFKNCRVREYDPAKDSEHRKKQTLYFVGEKNE